MLRTPREKFIATTNAEEFKKMAQHEAFEEATLTALLEMQSEMPILCTPNQAASAHDQMAGARRYVDILCSLWQPQTNPKPKPKATLDYSAGV